MTDDSSGRERGLMLSRRAGLAAIAGLAAAPAASLAQTRAAPSREAWSTAWAATMQKQANAQTLSNQTVRHAVTSSVGGPKVRVRFSNEFGAQPLRVGAASVSSGGRTAKLTFNGAPTIILPPFAPMLSDPVDLAVAPLAEVRISLHLPDTVAAETFQRGNDKVSVLTAAGDFTGDPNAPGANGPVMFLSALEVQHAGPGLVILGDTKSAGPGTWPDFLPAEARGTLAVANRSMYAGLMALGAPGDSALARFDRDVLSVTGATHMLLFTGNNDLIQPGTQGSGGRILMDPALAQSAEQLIAAQMQAVTRARSAGLKVIGGTWPPYAGVEIPGYSAPEKLAKRDQVNAWMRNSGTFDLVIDFDAALRDPSDPQRLLPAYDSGNHFTPSEAGYRRMAQAAWEVLKSLP